MGTDKKILTQKILDFFDKNSNLILIAVLIFALILRLKYLTINQAVWYDEAEYLSVAKNWAFNLTSYQLHYIRPPLLPFLMAGLYKIGFDELGMRILVLLFSMVGVFFTYLVGKEIFNKWIGLIASFLMTIFYASLFYTARILTDLPSTTFWLISTWLFWKGMVKKESKWYLWLLGPFLVMGTLTRFPFGLIFFVLLLYLIITERFKFLKNRDLWISSLLGIVCFLPYASWYYLKYSKIPILGPAGFYGAFSQLSNYLKILPGVFQSSIPGFWGSLLIVFLLGFLIISFNLIIGFDKIGKDNELKKYTFIWLWTIIPFIFFAFFAGQIAEDRYLFYLYPATFIIVGFALIKIYDFIMRFNKIFALFIVLLVLISASVAQISYADRIIKIKSTSYIQFKEAGKWIKENSNPGDKIIAAGQPQLNYYSERDIIYWPEDYEMNEFVKDNEEVKYIVLSALERTSEWTYLWPMDNPDKAIPVQAYPDSQQRPILIIYEVKR